MASRRFILDQRIELKNNGPGVVFELGDCTLRLVDWSFDEESEPGPESGIESTQRHRLSSEFNGRITKDYKIAPFYAHIKENESGY